MMPLIEVTHRAPLITHLADARQRAWQKHVRTLCKRYLPNWDESITFSNIGGNYCQTCIEAERNGIIWGTYIA